MKLAAVGLITTALSLSLPLAGAYRPLAGDAGNRANLTQILTPDRPFQTFLRYLNQTNLLEVFQNQAYRTHQGITIFVPADRAFAAVQPSVIPTRKNMINTHGLTLSNSRSDMILATCLFQVLAGLKKHQLKNLMMYHALARFYALKEFDGLRRANPVTTFAGGLYTVNVTYDAGGIRLLSRWAEAKIVGTVYGTAAPMAVYEVDRVLLPEAIFRVQPPVDATPTEPAPAASAPDAKGVDATTTPGNKTGGKSSACRTADRSARYAPAMALCAAALVAL
jgi:uncharacterized surface protein with fasciclin (FAS1) repeats